MGCPAYVAVSADKFNYPGGQFLIGHRSLLFLMNLLMYMVRCRISSGWISKSYFFPW